jgi:hypothetical protein
MTDELFRCDACGSMVSEEPHGMSLRPHRCTERQREHAEPAWCVLCGERHHLSQSCVSALTDGTRHYVPEESE